MRSVLAFVLVLVLQGVAFSEQAAPTAMPCSGDIAVVRVSKLKPTGTMAAFMKAVDAHRAWYRSHGITTNDIFTAPVLVEDSATKTMKVSATEVMSFHVRPPAADAKLPQTDAAWDAFVAQYRAVSDIANEWTVCMPKQK
jgi:hypothetical protein